MTHWERVDTGNEVHVLMVDTDGKSLGCSFDKYCPCEPRLKDMRDQGFLLVLHNSVH